MILTITNTQSCGSQIHRSPSLTYAIRRSQSITNAQNPVAQIHESVSLTNTQESIAHKNTGAGRSQIHKSLSLTNTQDPVAYKYIYRSLSLKKYWSRSLTNTPETFSHKNFGVGRSQIHRSLTLTGCLSFTNTQEPVNSAILLSSYIGKIRTFKCHLEMGVYCKMFSV